MKPVFRDGFSNELDVFGAFDVSDIDSAGVELLYAEYEHSNYEGNAFVLFRENGRLYEVNAGHCSCNGLENQWEPEETTIAELKYRLEHGIVMFDKAFLDELEKEEQSMKRNTIPAPTTQPPNPPIQGGKAMSQTDIEQFIKEAVEKAVNSAKVSKVIGEQVDQAINEDSFDTEIEDLVNEAIDSDDIQKLLMVKVKEELTSRLDDIVADMVENMHITLE